MDFTTLNETVARGRQVAEQLHSRGDIEKADEVSEMTSNFENTVRSNPSFALRAMRDLAGDAEMYAKVGDERSLGRTLQEYDALATQHRGTLDAFRHAKQASGPAGRLIDTSPIDRAMPENVWATVQQYGYEPTTFLREGNEQYWGSKGYDEIDALGLSRAAGGQVDPEDPHSLMYQELLAARRKGTPDTEIHRSLMLYKEAIPMSVGLFADATPREQALYAKDMYHMMQENPFIQPQQIGNLTRNLMTAFQPSIGEAVDPETRSLNEQMQRRQVMAMTQRLATATPEVRQSIPIMNKILQELPTGRVFDGTASPEILISEIGAVALQTDRAMRNIRALTGEGVRILQQNAGDLETHLMRYHASQAGILDMESTDVKHSREVIDSIMQQGPRLKYAVDSGDYGLALATAARVFDFEGSGANFIPGGEERTSFRALESQRQLSEDTETVLDLVNPENTKSRLEENLPGDENRELRESLYQGVREVETQYRAYVNAPTVQDRQQPLTASEVLRRSFEGQMIQNEQGDWVLGPNGNKEAFNRAQNFLRPLMEYEQRRSTAAQLSSAQMRIEGDTVSFVSNDGATLHSMEVEGLSNSPLSSRPGPEGGAKDLEDNLRRQALRDLGFSESLDPLQPPTTDVSISIPRGTGNRILSQIRNLEFRGFRHGWFGSDQEANIRDWEEADIKVGIALQDGVSGSVSFSRLFRDREHLESWVADVPPSMWREWAVGVGKVASLGIHSGLEALARRTVGESRATSRYQGQMNALVAEALAEGRLVMDPKSGAVKDAPEPYKLAPRGAGRRPAPNKIVTLPNEATQVIDVSDQDQREAYRLIVASGGRALESTDFNTVVERVREARTAEAAAADAEARQMQMLQKRAADIGITSSDLTDLSATIGALGAGLAPGADAPFNTMFSAIGEQARRIETRQELDVKMRQRFAEDQYKAAQQAIKEFSSAIRREQNREPTVQELQDVAERTTRILLGVYTSYAGQR